MSHFSSIRSFNTSIRNFKFHVILNCFLTLGQIGFLQNQLLINLTQAKPRKAPSNPVPGSPPEEASLSDILGNKEIKFVFVGGKGGVGKTTTSSGLSIELARNGRRVLLLSTDPAHSLSDAFARGHAPPPQSVLAAAGRGEKVDTSSAASSNAVSSESDSNSSGLPKSFSGEPTDVSNEVDFSEEKSKDSEFSGSLQVMEIDPTKLLKAEIGEWTEILKPITSNSGEIEGSDTTIADLQSWLSSVPGIDEAVALATAIEQIQSGKYDTIVFDTAPTGHTIKLLQLPEVLKSTLEKLESWQATLWGYWDTFKTLTSGNSGRNDNQANIKDQVAGKISTMKTNVEKVAAMLKDRKKTRFVAVCIAESLSVNETRRLLTELEKFKVRSNHIVVNQLIHPTMDTSKAKASVYSELKERLSKSLKKSSDENILQETLDMIDLVGSRRTIQQKYLSQLKSFPEVASDYRVVEMPLLDTEVTGTKMLSRFGKMLSGQKLTKLNRPKRDAEIHAVEGREHSTLEALEQEKIEEAKREKEEEDSDSEGSEDQSDDKNNKASKTGTKKSSDQDSSEDSDLSESESKPPKKKSKKSKKSGGLDLDELAKMAKNMGLGGGDDFDGENIADMAKNLGIDLNALGVGGDSNSKSDSKSSTKSKKDKGSGSSNSKSNSNKKGSKNRKKGGSGGGALGGMNMDAIKNIANQMGGIEGITKMMGEGGGGGGLGDMLKNMDPELLKQGMKEFGLGGGNDEL